MLRPAQPWYRLARQQLERLRSAPWGWGQMAHETPGPAPTVLASLALLATDDEPALPDTLEWVDASAQFLVDQQRADGAVGVTELRSSLCRSTACAALLWSQLLHFRRPLANALRWLQQCEEFTPSMQDDLVPGRCPAQEIASGRRAAAPSLLEPPALAILSLCRNQLTGHQWIADRTQWMLEQSLPSGGWNAGTTLPSDAQPVPEAGPTGVVLLALRAAGLSETDAVTRACGYLERVLPHELEPESLSWGLLGYNVWRPQPSDAPQWLQRCYAHAPRVTESPTSLALLLLADRPRTYALLGVSPARAEVVRTHPMVPDFLAV